MIEIIGKTKDYRTNTNVLYGKIAVKDYIKLVGENFDRFKIQRKREVYQAYSRMREDIVKGALLPTITLAINPDVVNEYLPLLEEENYEKLEKKLLLTEDLYILDGLQRTYIIYDLIKEKRELIGDQELLIEFWFEDDIKHLIYRLIVLNAGQKPMSMKHQVELLFMTMENNLRKDIPELEIYTDKDTERRNKAKKFPFDRIVTAYYSYLTKSPEAKRENIVVKQMSEKDILNMSEDSLSEIYNDFKDYLSEYTILDGLVFDKYKNFPTDNIRGARNWLADENVINSFFAALSIYSTTPQRRQRIEEALTNLKQKFESKEVSDPLDLAFYSQIRRGFNPRKINVGYATRKLITNGFKEFFRDSGESNFVEYWKMSVD